MSATERVCATQPKCWCIARDPFSCNCIARGNAPPLGSAGDVASDCRKCGCNMVTVRAYERIMKRAAAKARRARNGQANRSE